MSEYTSFLITILFKHEDDYSIVNYAIKVRNDLLPDDFARYPMEPENREQLYQLLPAHMKGSIVAVERIGDVVICEAP